MTASPHSFRTSANLARQKSRELLARLREERLAKKPSPPLQTAAEPAAAPQQEPNAPDDAPAAILEVVVAELSAAHASPAPLGHADSHQDQAVVVPDLFVQDQLVQAIADAVERALAARTQARGDAGQPASVEVAGESGEAEPPADAMADSAPLSLVRNVLSELERVETLQAAAEAKQDRAAEAKQDRAAEAMQDIVEAPQSAVETAPALAADDVAPDLSSPPSDDPAPVALAAAVNAPMPLERMDMLGPGLRWRLAQLGYGSVNALAEADAEALGARLGEIGRLANVRTWIDAARSLSAAAPSH